MLEGVEGCGQLSENLDWLYGGREGLPVSFTLSAPINHYEFSEPLTVLKPGEFFVFWFRVLQVGQEGQFSQALEIDTHAPKGGQRTAWVLTFVPGQDRIHRGYMRIDQEYKHDIPLSKFPVSWYRPGSLNQARLSFCSDGKRIFLELNDVLIKVVIDVVAPEPRQILTRVVGMSAEFLGYVGSMEGGDMTRCTNCGYENQPNAHLCAQCGGRLEETPAPALKPRLRLRLSKEDEQMKVHLLDGPEGQMAADFNEPFVADRAAIMTKLEKGWFVSPGLLALHKRVGRKLFTNILPQGRKKIAKIRQAVLASIKAAQDKGLPLLMQVEFDADAVSVAQLPWELIHDGSSHLSLDEVMHLNRYVTYFGDRKPFEPVDQLNILYVIARPADQEHLPDHYERDELLKAMGNLIRKGRVQVDVLETATFAEMQNALENGNYHILHWDGHGGFVDGVGYLCFEDASNATDHVSAQQLADVLQGSSVRLVLLSACQSAMVGGVNIFNTFGPALVRNKIPAVIAFQYTVPVMSTSAFTKEFYRSIARGEPISSAVADGRKAMAGLTRTWFFPALYMRVADGEGYLFSGEPEEHFRQRMQDLADLAKRWALMVPALQALYPEGAPSWPELPVDPSSSGPDQGSRPSADAGPAAAQGLTATAPPRSQARGRAADLPESTKKVQLFFIESSREGPNLVGLDPVEAKLQYLYGPKSGRGGERPIWDTYSAAKNRDIGQISPDGKWLVVPNSKDDLGDSNFFLIDLEDPDRKAIVFDVPYVYPPNIDQYVGGGGRGYQFLNWHPDSNQFIISIKHGPSVAVVNPHSNELFHISADDAVALAGYYPGRYEYSISRNIFLRGGYLFHEYKPIPIASSQGLSWIPDILMGVSITDPHIDPTSHGPPHIGPMSPQLLNIGWAAQATRHLYYLNDAPLPEYNTPMKLWKLGIDPFSGYRLDSRYSELIDIVEPRDFISLGIDGSYLKLNLHEFPGVYKNMLLSHDRTKIAILGMPPAELSPPGSSYPSDPRIYLIDAGLGDQKYLVMDYLDRCFRIDNIVFSANPHILYALGVYRSHPTKGYWEHGEIQDGYHMPPATELLRIDMLNNEITPLMRLNQIMDGSTLTSRLVSDD